MGRVVRLGWRPGWSIRGSSATRGCRSGGRPPWWGTGRVVRLGWRPWWSIRGSTATRGRRSRVGPPPEGVDPGSDRLGGERDGWSAWAGARVADPGFDHHQRASIRGPTALVGNGTGGPPGPGPGWPIRGPTATRGRRSGDRPPWWGTGRVVRLGRGQGGRSRGRPPPEGVDPGADRLGGERDGWSAWAGGQGGRSGGRPPPEGVDPGIDRLGGERDGWSAWAGG